MKNQLLKLFVVLVLSWICLGALWLVMVLTVQHMDHEAHKTAGAIGTIATFLICIATLIFAFIVLLKSRLPWPVAVIAALVSVASILFELMFMTMAFWA